MDTWQLAIYYGFMLYGFGLVVSTIWVVLKAGRAQTWPTVSGTILKSQVDEKMGRNRLMYWPEIRYEYVVHGERHESDVWRLGAKKLRLSWPSYAQRAVARYPVGQPVTVFYTLITQARLYWSRERLIGRGSFSACCS